jgi:hypothetical protein
MAREHELTTKGSLQSRPATPTYIGEVILCSLLITHGEHSPTLLTGSPCSLVTTLLTGDHSSQGGVVIFSTIALIPRNDYAGPRNAETVPGNIHRPRTSFCFGTCLGLGQASTLKAQLA